MSTITDRALVRVTFDLAGTFEALHAAQNWCREHGVSYGSTQGDMPVGLLYGDFGIAKWRNLSKRDTAALDGRMFGDFRNGPVHLQIRERAP